ncbi:hypothetical protein AB1046_00080 [Promicromonospora sp. Populi]|uniref:hypothetical protein n=1 Tax=Promicromonospora sp. Populi TaxID=3239420 RepID=UPI0034E1DB58
MSGLIGDRPPGRLEDVDFEGDVVEGRREELMHAANFTVRRWASGTPDGMNVAIIEPVSNRHDDIVIMPASHDYRIDRLLLHRLQLLAAVLQRRVVTVESPGITMDFVDPRATRPAALDPHMIRSLHRGDFTPLAAMQWNAVKEVLGYTPAAVRLVGESLGAQFSMSMLPAIDSPVLSVDLVEAVNPNGLAALELARHGWHLRRGEESLRMQYVDLNAMRGWPVITSFERSSPENASIDRELKSWRLQGRAAFAMAWGLRSGIVGTLRATVAAGAEPGDLGLWRMRDSRVSSMDSSRLLLDELERAGWSTRGFNVGAKLFPLPLGHHALTSFDLMVAFGDALIRRWD